MEWNGIVDCAWTLGIFACRQDNWWEQPIAPWSGATENTFEHQDPGTPDGNLQWLYFPHWQQCKASYVQCQELIPDCKLLQKD